MGNSKCFARVALHAALYTGQEATAWEMDKMAFVFHQTRHGARAIQSSADMSLFADDLAALPAEVGMLTPQGMRQRYLKGRSNRVRYSQTYQLLSPEFTPGQLYVQSTDYHRTKQSALSEMMGLYPPAGMSDGINLLPDALREELGDAHPPFNVRQAD